MSDRLVLVRVTDPDVDTVEASHWVDGYQVSESRHPVPEDDQHLQDIMALSEWAEANYRQAIHGAHEQMLRPYVKAARRLRAAFGLDQEDDNE